MTNVKMAEQVQPSCSDFLCSLLILIIIIKITFFGIQISIVQHGNENTSQLFENISKPQLLRDLLLYHLKREQLINESWINKTEFIYEVNETRPFNDG